MNSLVDTLNSWASHALAFLWPMLWQSSLLIVLLFGLDLAARRKARAAVRYSLWLVVLLKLLLPPSLAFPTGVAWWLRPSRAEPPPPHQSTFMVHYGPSLAPAAPPMTLTIPTPTAPKKPTLEAALCFVWGAGAFALLAYMLARWRGISLIARQATPAPEWLNKLNFLGLDHPSRITHLPRRSGAKAGHVSPSSPVIKVTDHRLSPAVCGLFRPVILLPRALLDQLPQAQLRAVLLHEKMHLRRGDVWVNCAQALLQAVYWWHPLLWLANGRIRRLREEAVDDAVMLALREDAECYAPTLLEVAKVALRRPFASLCLVGILEPRSSLQKRIERLLEFRPPKKAGLTVTSAIGLLSLSALALPMGQAPASNSTVNVGSRRSATAPSQVFASTLVQDGKLLFEAGKLDEAEAKLKLAIKLDPQNQPAYYYLNLINERRLDESHNIPDPRRELLPQPNLYARTNLIWTGHGRQIIESKLRRIHLDSFGFRGLPLSEVVRNLYDEAKKRDPEERGINFIYNANMDSGGAGAIHPDTGLPVPTAPAEPVDVGAIRINIDPPITNITLADALDVIVKTTERPIKYSIEDYAVVFSLKGQKAAPLYNRTFKVDPKAFEQGLQSAVGTAFASAQPTGDGHREGGRIRSETRTNEMANVQRMLRSYFTALGIDWQNPPGKVVFYSDTRGTLLVRATLSDLDLIEQGVQALDIAPPQINIKERIVEVEPGSSTITRFNWYLDNFLLANNASGLGTNLSASTIGTNFMGVLTDPQLRVVLAAAKDDSTVKVRNEFSVTTLSGRQAEMQEIEMLTNQLGSKIDPGWSPAIDTVAYVGADDSNLDLTVIAKLPEFIGFGAPEPSGVTSLSGVLPLPHFRLRQFTTSANVPDGQTLVIGRINAVGLSKLKEIEETVGGNPSPSTMQELEASAQKGQLIIFITPTVIDAAGNRLHPDN